MQYLNLLSACFTFRENLIYKVLARAAVVSAFSCIFETNLRQNIYLLELSQAKGSFLMFARDVNPLYICCNNDYLMLTLARSHGFNVSKSSLPRPLNAWLATDLSIYLKISKISHTLVVNKRVDHSDVTGASPVGAAPTTSSFLTKNLASMDWAETTARRDEKHLNFGICWMSC